MPSAVFSSSSEDRLCEKENLPEVENVDNDKRLPPIKNNNGMSSTNVDDPVSPEPRTRHFVKTSLAQVAGPSSSQVVKKKKTTANHKRSSDAGSSGARNKKKSIAADQNSLDTMFARAKSNAAVKTDSEHVVKVEIGDDVEVAINSDAQTEPEPEPRPEKKIKLDEVEEEPITPQPPKPRTDPIKCQICRQILNDGEIKLYQGHPNGAVEEFIALTDPRLSLFTGEEDMINESDERPQNKLTHFSVYDKNGHLCPFDSGLIERNVLLYFSGYMKAIYEENPDPDGGVPAMDMGPINEWWVSGFDGGELALIGFSTAFGEYILMEPSEAYAPFMEAVREKIHISKLAIEFILDELNPSYEDLLNKLQVISEFIYVGPPH